MTNPAGQCGVQENVAGSMFSEQDFTAENKQGQGDLISLLCHPHRILTKTWQTDVTIRACDEAKHFDYRPVVVKNIRELSKLLAKLENDPHCCAVRGEFVGWEEAKKICPEAPEGKVRRKTGVFRDAKKHQVLIEVDNFKPSEHDPVLDPVGSAEEFITKHLPKEFGVASFHWQLSSSAGHPTKAGVFKAHLWFWSEVPVSCEELTAWAKAYPEVDASVFRVVQINYTANPVFAEGVADPVPVRSGFVEGISDTVLLNLDVLPLKTSNLQRGTRLDVVDERLAKLEEKGLVNGYTPEGYALIDCPNKHNHSCDSGPTQTVYMPAGTNGEKDGHYRCLHEHCSGLTDGWFDKQLDIYIEDFSVEDFEVEEPTPPKKNRFTPIPVGEFIKRPPMGWRVKHVIPDAEVGTFYGASQAGKSVLIMDALGAMARGKSWLGQKTKQCACAYIIAEGVGGAPMRLNAYGKYHGIDMAALPIAIIPVAPNLMQVGDVDELADAIGKNVGVIVIDTFAQCTPGADENTSKDMGRALANCKKLHALTGALIILVAHVGKDASRGIRGWSGVFAACDFAIEVTRDGGDRSFRIAKQKDGRDGQTWRFGLKEVVVGIDEDGDEIKSAVCEIQDTGDDDFDEPDADDRHANAMRIFEETAREHGRKYRGRVGVAATVFRQALAEKMPFRTEKTDSRRALARRLVDELIDKKNLTKNDANLLFARTGPVRGYLDPNRTESEQSPLGE